jgi:hypothetical protein
MMSNRLAVLSLAAAVAGLVALAAPAEARRERPCHQGRAAYLPYGGGGYGGDAAWEIVRRDPCRWDEYVRFAERHKNPNKRQRFAERLAREGCSRPPAVYGYGYDGYDPYRGRGPYGYGNGDRYGYPAAGLALEDLVYPLTTLLLGR